MAGAIFENEIARPPRVWAEKIYNVTINSSLQKNIASKDKKGNPTQFTLDVNVTSTSLVELNASCRVSLTPSASTSKFLFQVQFPYFVTNSNTGFFINFYRLIWSNVFISFYNN